MGQNPTRTMREIDQIRDRIDAELDELEQALPEVETVKQALKQQVLPAAVGGVVALFTLWFVVHRIRVVAQNRRVRRIIRQAIEEAEPQS